MEQLDVNILIKHLEEKGFTESEILDILRSIIKQQMLYGGDLAEKMQFYMTQKK